MFVKNDAGKQNFVDFLSFVRCLLTNILQIQKVSFLYLTYLIIVNCIVTRLVPTIGVSAGLFAEGPKVVVKVCLWCFGGVLVVFWVFWVFGCFGVWVFRCLRCFGFGV